MRGHLFEGDRPCGLPNLPAGRGQLAGPADGAGILFGPTRAGAERIGVPSVGVKKVYFPSLGFRFLCVVLLHNGGGVPPPFLEQTTRTADNSPARRLLPCSNSLTVDMY